MTVRDVEVVCTAGATLALAGTALALRDWVARRSVRPSEVGGSVPLLVVGFAVGVMIVAAKLMTIARFGVDLPFWDQFEEAFLYRDLRAGTLSWSFMIAPHNEHRIFLGRALALLLEVRNGQWDNRLQAVVNAAFHAVAGVVLLAATSRPQRRGEFAILAVVVTLVLGFPFAHENVTWGFQSAFYLEILFSTLGIALVLRSDSWSAGRVVGVACAGAGVLTLGTGALGPFTIAAVELFATVVERRGRRALVTSAGPLLGIAAVCLLAIVRLPSSRVLEAHGIRDFVVALGRDAAWPLVHRPWLGPVLWLPYAMTAWSYVAGSGERPRQRVLLGLGGWVLLHDVAMAFARGADGAGPASRYADLLGVGLLVNAAAALDVATATRRPLGRWVRSLAGAAWFALAAAGAVGLARPILVEVMPRYAGLSQRQIENVRQFVRTDDIRWLRAKPELHIPYPSADLLAVMLRLPHTRAILPASVRDPPWRGPWTRRADWLLEHGRQLLAAGIAIALVGLAVGPLGNASRRARGARGPRPPNRHHPDELPSDDRGADGA